mgnify:CR=1 FL=1
METIDAHTVKQLIKEAFQIPWDVKNIDFSVCKVAGESTNDASSLGVIETVLWGTLLVASSRAILS